MVYQPSWPAKPLDIGQVGGVAADKDGNIFIFHRGRRAWDYNSFDMDNNFRYQNVPIDQDVVLITDKNGNTVKEFGKQQFFLPHGITVDLEGNIWVTDVALHQVFKLRKNDTQPVLTLGHRFKHSSDDLSYFCKPADVAVMSTGDFFVADGYCNSWIKKYNKNGVLINAWGKNKTRLRSNQESMEFNIVHSIAVSEKDNLVCAADRENGRIQCFDLDGGFKHIIKHKEFGSKLFAIDFSPLHGGVLYAVNGHGYDGRSSAPVQGFTMDMKNGALVDTWNLPQGLKKPHDVCVDPISDSVFVGELDPRMVWKFTRMSDEEAKSVFVDLNHHDDDDDDDDHINQKDASDATDSKKEQKVVSATPSATEKSYIVSSHSNNSSSTAESQKMVLATKGLSASMVMGMVLVIPVVLLLIVVLVVRNYRAGNLNFLTSGGRGKKRIFNMQNILGNSHKGFDPLSTEESDHDLDPNDSDHEEYAAPRKTKT